MVAKVISSRSRVELYGLASRKKILKRIRVSAYIRHDPYSDRRELPVEATSPPSAPSDTRSPVRTEGRFAQQVIDRPRWGTITGPKPSDLPITRQVEMAINRRMWRIYAEKSLERYNKMQLVEFKLSEVNGLRMDSRPERRVHMNFSAYETTDIDRVARLFYAELVVPPSTEKRGIEVKGCCVIRKVGDGDPSFDACGICWTHIMHPAPRYGYIIESGDNAGISFLLGVELLRFNLVKPQNS